MWNELGQPSIHLIVLSCPSFPSQFMDSMQLDPDTVDNLDAYNHIPPQLMEKCAALSVRPDTVKNLVQSMQGEQSTQQTDAQVACKPSAMASPMEDASEALVHPDAPVDYFLCVWSLSSAGKQALT